MPKGIKPMSEGMLIDYIVSAYDILPHEKPKLIRKVKALVRAVREDCAKLCIDKTDAALRARVALLEKVVVDAIAETRKWYAINIFSPPDEDIVKAIHRQYPGTVDRLSADMARRTCDLVLSNYRAALKEG